MYPVVQDVHQVTEQVPFALLWDIIRIRRIILGLAIWSYSQMQVLQLQG